jgi:4-amino-4-deoxy-L-arabinose transferase-like glycosyltransferase
LTARHYLWIAASVAIALVGLTYNFAGYPLLDPDEGRNAEVAREMAEQNDYVLPRINGLPYVDKPVLFFAAAALVMEVLGPTTLAARLPALVFTLATLGVVWWFARRRYDPRTAWTAAIATAATPFTLAYARTVIFDSALTLWVVVALVGFYEATEISPRTQDDHATKEADPRLWWRALAWAAMALGVLTKGPIALALPLLVAVPYAVWRRRSRALVDATSVLLFVAIVLPWVYAVSRDVPGFLHHALVTETVRRLATTDLQRTGPVWYFLAILPAAALPWAVVLLAGWRRPQRPGRPRRGWLDDRRVVFLLLWLLVPLAFFSLSQSKRPQYVLPLVPALGLLVGAWWHDVRGRLPGARAAAVFLGLAGTGLILGREGISSLLPAAGPTVAASIPGTACALGAICLAAGVLAWLATARRALLLCALSLPVAAIPVTSARLMRAIGADRSTEELARAIDRVADAGTEIVGVQAFPLSLPFYLRRTLTLSTADGSELTSNYLTRSHEYWTDQPDSPLRDHDWWLETLTECRSSRVFVTRAEDSETRGTLQLHLPLLAITPRWAAYGPCVSGLLASASGNVPPRNRAP